MIKIEFKELEKDAYYYEKSGMLFKGDCLEWMAKFSDKSIDMILCDLPYGTTRCKWDVIIPFESLWDQYKRIIKNNGAICLFGSEPFSSYLRISNIQMYKYDWVWDKVNKYTRYFLAKKMPLLRHENISVFYKKSPNYFPQFRKGKPYISSDRKSSSTEIYNDKIMRRKTYNIGNYYPSSVLEIKGDEKRFGEDKHPTQKPVALCEYLIKTYTDENEIVLDNTAGLCTTAIACKNTNRQWVCIEKDDKYCDMSVNRIKNYKTIQ